MSFSSTTCTTRFGPGQSLYGTVWACSRTSPLLALLVGRQFTRSTTAETDSDSSGHSCLSPPAQFLCSHGGLVMQHELFFLTLPTKGYWHECLTVKLFLYGLHRTIENLIAPSSGERCKKTVRQEIRRVSLVGRRKTAGD